MTLGAMFLAASACSAQCGTASAPNPTPVAATPTPSPTAAPTALLHASSPPFHDGEAGLAYAPVALSATGGRAPYTWTVSSGALPDGLTLGKDGSVSGTPTTGGTFSFTIQVADSADSTARIRGTVSIADQLTASLVSSCAQYCRVELGCDSTCGTFGHLEGGVGPYSFSLTQGPLPAGTSLHGFSLSGTFTGSPGWLQFGVLVSDSLGATATLSPRFWMYDHISLNGGTCGPSRVQCSVTLPYSGGTPAQQITAAPAGWTGGNCGFTAVQPCPQPTFAASYKPGSVTLTLTYQANYPATFGTMTVRLTSSDPCGSGAQCASTATVSVQG